MITKCADLLVGDQAAGKFEERFVDVDPALPADAQASEVMQRREAPFDDPAVGASPVPWWFPRRGGHDAAVGEERVGPAAGRADVAADRRDRVEQGDELSDVIAVSAGQQIPERGAVSVSVEVVFLFCPSAVDRRGTCVAPPLEALTWEESTTQRDQPSREAALSPRTAGLRGAVFRSRPRSSSAEKKSGGQAAAIWTGNATVGQRIGQWVDNSAADSWKLIKTDDGFHRLQSVKNPILYLTGTSDGAPVTLQNAAADGSQEWEPSSRLYADEPDARREIGC